MQAKIDELESMKVVKKAVELNIVPKYASPTLLVKKQSAKEVNYDKLPIHEKIKHNRFVLCLNKLNTHIEKILAKCNRLDETIRKVGNRRYV